MLRAIEQIRRMRGSAQSHLMRCSDGNYYVVKFQNNPQHRRILVNELLGTRLASRLGLPTASVNVVEVHEELIRLTTELCREEPGEYARVRRLHPAADELLLRMLRNNLEDRSATASELFRGSGDAHAERNAWTD
jgi:HipA-like kinase